MADIQSHDEERARALNNSYLCYFLAFLVMAGTGWVIWQGVEAMEPDSPARNSKIYQYLVMLVLEGFIFSLAGQYRKYAFWLRVLGWSIFALQIVLMTLANYSIGATAGKVAALKTATVAEIQAQADASRKTAATLRESAAKLNKSKHGFLNEQGGNAATEAAQQTRAAASAADQISKIQVGTPIVDKIGENWLMTLSGALAVITECLGIGLMHYGGCLRNDALGSGPAIDVQTLHAVRQVLDALGVDAPAPAAASAAPAKQAAMPVYSSWTGKGIPLATVGALGALGAAQTVQAAPIKPAAPGAQAVAPVNVDPPAPVKKARKARVAHDGAVMDTGVGEHDGYRYRGSLQETENKAR